MQNNYLLFNKFINMAVFKTTDYWDQTSHLKMIDEFFDEAMSKNIDKVVWLDLFDEEFNNHKNDTILLEDWVAWVKYIPENSEYPDAEPWETSSMILTKYKYGAKIVITEEMKLYNQIGSMQKRIGSIVADGLEKLDQSLADILLHGFSADSYVDVYGQSCPAIGQDGRALFNAYDDNIIKTKDGLTTNPELCSDALDSIYIKGATYTNRLGQHVSIDYDTLLVSPANRSKALILTESEHIPWSADNAINVNKGKFKVKVWNRLASIIKENGNNVDTSLFWFVYDSEKIKDQLKVKWARHPQLIKAWEVKFDANEVHRFSYIYSRGFLNKAYIAWSKWTEAVAEEGIAVKVVD